MTGSVGRGAAPVTPESHLEWILAGIGRTGTAMLGIEAAHGLALAEDVTARISLPLWDASAMDGYAMRAVETLAASERAPARLRLIGEIAAGSDEDPALPAGCAVRIMTGAPVPSDADAVVPVEAAAGESGVGAWGSGTVGILHPVAVGANVRRRGEDVRAGEVIAWSGESLGAVRCSAIAAADVDVVLVHRAPRIAVVSTGSELRRPGTGLGRGQVPESNSVQLSGQLAEAGFMATTVEHRSDDAIAFAAHLRELAAVHDVVITTGGVGPGRHDVVRLALEEEPGVRSVRVAVRPGQPQCAGRHSAGAFVFALPGNPVSAAVSFELFVRPALRALAGHRRIHRRRLVATAGASWSGRAGRLQVLPVTIEESAAGPVCRPAVPAAQVSHSVGRHGGTDGYAIVGPERSGVREGESVLLIETGPP